MVCELDWMCVLWNGANIRCCGKERSSLKIIFRLRLDKRRIFVRRQRLLNRKHHKVALFDILLYTDILKIERGVHSKGDISQDFSGEWRVFWIFLLVPKSPLSTTSYEIFHISQDFQNLHSRERRFHGFLVESGDFMKLYKISTFH